MPILDHFGIIAPFYDRVIGQREPRRLIELLGLPRGGALLDAGGGTGRVSQALQAMVDLVVVADESAEMLVQAAQKPGLRPTQARVERLPFADGTFERIIMIDALHHVANQQHTADELWRVLKPGGQIVIEEPDIRTFAVKLVALGEKLALMRSHFLSPIQIASLFQAKKSPSARSRIEVEGWNAWVVIEKG
jgi:demethylmenaquinone methyltransferase/2-methoxy-6-polyprenyl-1,4-benzoquinol methylase